MATSPSLEIAASADSGSDLLNRLLSLLNPAVASTARGLGCATGASTSKPMISTGCSAYCVDVSLLMTAAKVPMIVNRIACSFICLPFSWCSCERLLFFVWLASPWLLVHLSGAFLSTGRLEGGFLLLRGGPPGNPPADGNSAFMNRLQLSSLALLGGVWVGLYAACALLPACGASESRLLAATTSWVGNSFGGGKRWVQQDIQAMVVTEDGTVYCNVPWDEAGREVGIYKDGDVIGIAQHTHGWGYDGGSAIALNQKYVFIAQRVGNEGGNLKGTNTWPPKGLSWYGVSRRLRADVTRGAPFSGGKGGQGDTLKGCFLVVIEAPEKAEGGIAGLCADEHRLYVSCAGTNEIRIYYFPATDTMYLAGYTAECPHHDGLWKVMGRVICRYDHWSKGQSSPRWQIAPDYTVDGSWKDKPASMSVAVDYVFVVYVVGGRIEVYDAQTGASVGHLKPGPEVGGDLPGEAVGWVDIPEGIQAIRRPDGEYLVLVEEDWKSKVLMYQWKPEAPPGKSR